MPPRRRTFYLADATILANPKIRRLMRHPDWLAAIGAFHVLMGVATLNASPDLSEADCDDILGEDNREAVLMLRSVGLMTDKGLDRETFEEWTPKARPKYPSDGAPPTPPESSGIKVTPPESSGIPTTVATSSSSSTTKSASSSSAGQGESEGDVALKARTAEYAAQRRERIELSERFRDNRISEAEYERRLKDIGKNPDDMSRVDNQVKS